jgi:hypothetical protein
MSILDPSFREQLRAKRAKTQAQPDDDDAAPRDVKGLADRDSLLRDVGADSSIQRFRREDVADEVVGNIAWPIHCSEARVDGSNDRLDPDYRVPLPEMPLAWWEKLVLGNADDTVTPQDVELAFRHISQRLSDREAPTGRLWNEKLDFISTLGELREAVQSLGELAWFEFQRAYHEAAGLKPKRQPKPDFAPIPAAEPHSKPDTTLPPLPDRTPPLDPGLHATLPTMNPRAVGFLLHTPKERPAWSYVESDSERAEREFLQDQGCWPGG